MSHVAGKEIPVFVGNLKNNMIRMGYDKSHKKIGMVFDSTIRIAFDNMIGMVSDRATAAAIVTPKPKKPRVR